VKKMMERSKRKKFNHAKRDLLRFKTRQSKETERRKKETTTGKDQRESMKKRQEVDHKSKKNYE
jgi:hypothetical protein